MYANKPTTGSAQYNTPTANKLYSYLYKTSKVQETVTYSSQTVVPLVHDVSVILIIKLGGKVIGVTRSTEHCHKTGIAVALLHIYNITHVQFLLPTTLPLGIKHSQFNRQ